MYVRYLINLGELTESTHHQLFQIGLEFTLDLKWNIFYGFVFWDLITIKDMASDHEVRDPRVLTLGWHSDELIIIEGINISHLIGHSDVFLNLHHIYAA